LKKAFGGSRQALPTIFWLSTADDDDDDDDAACPRANQSNEHAENTKDKSRLISAFSRVPTPAPKRALT
jgi:hypothetical protein